MIKMSEMLRTEANSLTLLDFNMDRIKLKWMTTLNPVDMTLEETPLHYPDRVVSTQHYLEMSNNFKTKVRNTIHPIIVLTSKGQMIFTQVVRLTRNRYIMPFHSYKILNDITPNVKFAFYTSTKIFCLTLEDLHDIRGIEIGPNNYDYIIFSLSFEIDYTIEQLQIKVTPESEQSVKNVINVSAFYSTKEQLDFYTSKIGSIYRTQRKIGMYNLYSNSELTTANGVKGMSGSPIIDDQLNLRGILIGTCQAYLFSDDLFKQL